MNTRSWSGKTKAAVTVTTLLGACLAASPASADAPANGAHVNSTFDGAFTFHACPAGAAPADFCLSDTLTGALPGMGPVIGHFEVDIHFGAFGSADCGPIEKHGTFTAADGSSVQIDAAGSYCNTPGVADYEYTVHGGTGAFTHAHGRGCWHVPAATAYVPGGGYGPETLTGSLHLF